MSKKKSHDLRTFRTTEESSESETSTESGNPINWNEAADRIRKKAALKRKRTVKSTENGTSE